jgi:heme/copper-type cytochrome/quinol oxidase subunit 2
MIIRHALARAALAATILSTVPSAQEPAPQERRVIRVRAERFHFTPSEIHVKAGEDVEFRIKSDDTAHGFRILGTDTDIVIPKRGQGETTVVFPGRAPGRYTFECSQMCGAGHSFMRGIIVVKEPTRDGRGSAR